jgi:uncharacterized protein (TIGR02246 family)
MSLKALALAGSVSLASCAVTNPVDDVQKVLQDLAAAESSENLDATAALYAPDAQWVPPNAPLVIGLSAIREKLRAIFEANDVEVDILAHEIRAAGDFAWVVGASRATTKPRNGGSPASSEDKYMMILQRYPDERWRIRYLMWNATGP